MAIYEGKVYVRVEAANMEEAENLIDEFLRTAERGLETPGVAPWFLSAACEREDIAYEEGEES